MHDGRFILLLLVLISAVRSQDRDKEASKFLWLSDIHLDPFYSSPEAVASASNLCTDEDSNTTFPYGQVGCDSPPTLFHEALRHAQQVVKASGGVEFVVVTGDLCRHANDLFHNPIASTRQILKRVVEAIQIYVPDTHVLVSVGNNDFTPDYYIDVEALDDNPMLNMVADAFGNIFISPGEKLSFRSGAYMTRNVSEILTLITLNTVMYANHHSPEQTHVDDPLGQFQWLAEQLQLAKDTGRRVYIVGHIPPSLGSYRRAQQWHESYTIRYYEIIEDFFPDVIAAQLFGHLHTDEFRLVNPSPSGEKKLYPLFMASSITPIYGSNPSYRLVHYDATTAQFLDYDTFYFDIAKNSSEPLWVHAPSFRQAFNVSDMSNESIEAIVQRMSDDSDLGSKTLWDAFLSRQNVHSSSNDDCDDPLCRREWICTISSITEDEYDSCLYIPLNDAAATLPLILIGAFAVFAVVIALFWSVPRCMKRKQYLSHLQDMDEAESELRESSSSGEQVSGNEQLPPIS